MQDLCTVCPKAWKIILLNACIKCLWSIGVKLYFDEHKERPIVDVSLLHTGTEEWGTGRGQPPPPPLLQ
jgi:hypothetical protein